VRPVLLVHGGAGRLERGRLGRSEQARIREGLRDALEAGFALLHAQQDPLAAVEAAVAALESLPEFNAGIGSVLASDGGVQMSASLMRGADRAAGAVAGVSDLRHPVHAARAVLEDGRCLLLIGADASRFARDAGVATATSDELITESRRADLMRLDAQMQLDHDADHGTVGAVACSADGRLAAATSTGGLTGQPAGRVGDTPIIGAGTWADDATVAVSATGVGEVFIRSAFAKEVDALIRYAGLSLQAACARALEQVSQLGGRGGCIAVTPGGDHALPFNTLGMLRGLIQGPGSARVAVFADEAL
jgi:isoaspartyl peptidase/L-asparaginase-like protein (Ntn-hydrolase superfamily)